MFYIDKYEPKNTNEAFFNKNILELLNIMSMDEEIPHIIFYGTEGTGKKTAIKLFLEMLFDKSIHNTKYITYKITGSGNKKTTETVKQSNYHIVIKPKNNNSDRYLIHDIVKEYAKKKTLNTFQTNRHFKIVLIHNIDNMSYYAQTSLRRTMERYSKNCRFIMWSRSLSRVITPLQSRCICIRIPAPSDKELFKYIMNISIRENIDISVEKYFDIVKKAKGNIKNALWELQFLKYNYALNTNYSNSINEIIKLILENKIENIQLISSILHNLMITNVDSIIIIRDIVINICNNPNFSDDLKCNIVLSSGDFENKLNKSRRDIIHFDAFIISCLYYINLEITKKHK
jgi:replication factor C subunit 3/5